MGIPERLCGKSPKVIKMEPSPLTNVLIKRGGLKWGKPPLGALLVCLFSLAPPFITSVNLTVSLLLQHYFHLLRGINGLCASVIKR